ncbi:hypothetical protein [Burkholderia sp. BCC1638]|uniref:hypothetical protein n=1 Tax=Burkholderia sp. BCC1638 TaxID=2681391 RepID=UPI00158C341B|nr:hypothetical protein [Burkholderia sp. BCC1638]
MTAAPVLHLERPAFWTESGDPESWFRALEAFAGAAQRAPQTGTPRAVADRSLVGVIARRGAAGLFGVFQREGRALLPGVGLIACDAEGRWDLTDESRILLRHWKEDAQQGLELLAAYLVRESPWLRLLLARLQQGDWELARWAEVRSGRTGLKAGSSLLLRDHVEPETWFDGLAEQTAARWLARAHCEILAYDPDVLTRKKGKDDLSLTPLTAPLHLLESVDWLSRTGQVTLPSALEADLVGKATPAQVLTDIISGHADVRGFVAAEPVLRELLRTFGVSPSDEAFARWMDALIDLAAKKGALELLDAQPGQARHGRGLHADPTRKLVRWVVHTEFNEAFQNAWAALETERELIR